MSNSYNWEDLDEDDRLMCQLQQGDAAAFEELVKRHYEGLRAFFEMRSSSVRSRQMAEDMAQDVLLKVYNEAQGFVPQGKFKAWMYRIARNLLIDVARREAYDALIGNRQGGEQDDQLSHLQSESTAIVDQADTRELGDTVAKLLADLPEDQMLTFKMHHYLGLSLPEVAEAMETNTATTKSRLRLAKEKLREKLQIRGYSGEEIEEL